MSTSLNMTISSSIFNDAPELQLNNYLYIEERLLSIRILSPISLLLILVGVIFNTINLIVFYKAGVKDNVTTLLFSLAISDTAYLCLSSLHACFWTIWIFASSPQALREPFSTEYDENFLWPIQFRFILDIVYWPAYLVYDISCFISLSLGVMRCACVAMPLKFKLVFTKSRTVKWLLFLVVFAVSLRIPVLSMYKLIWLSKPKTNTTYLFALPVNARLMIRINDIMNRSIVVWTSFSLMVACVGILTFKLRQASKMRRSCTNQNSSRPGQEMSAKDVKVVKSVVLVCSIFIFSQLPMVFLSLIRLFNSHFGGQSQLDGVRIITAYISITCCIFNASVNIFVYYNYNSRYRAVFLSLFNFSSSSSSSSQ